MPLYTSYWFAREENRYLWCWIKKTSRYQHWCRHSSIFQETFFRQTFHQMQVLSAKVRQQTFRDLTSKSTDAIVGLCNRQVSKKVAANISDISMFPSKWATLVDLWCFPSLIFSILFSVALFFNIFFHSSKYSIQIFAVILDYVLFCLIDAEHTFSKRETCDNLIVCVFNRFASIFRLAAETI